MPPFTPAQFFNASQFAVLGASANTEKFGYKVLSWYIDHSLRAIPINPSTPSILDHECVKSLAEVPEPTKTSVSVITPPHITLKALEDVKNLGFRGVWLQPGTFDDNVLKKAEELGVGVVAGGGACVLIHGEGAMREASKL